MLGTNRALLLAIQRSLQLLHEKVDIVTSQQDNLDADVQGLQSDLATLQANFASELASLQAALANGQPVDLSGLEAIKAQFDQLATSTAPAPPATPPTA